MSERPTPIELAERVAIIARGLGVETALIGAGALAVHNYVRATQDLDLASMVDPYLDLRRLEEALVAAGYRAKRNLPDDQDPLGGLVRVWVEEDEANDPVNPVDVVNFMNPHNPQRTPASDAIRDAIPLSESALRCVRLPHLVALKLYTGARSDQNDVIELLARNPDADLEEIRATCKKYGLDVIDELLAGP